MREAEMSNSSFSPKVLAAASDLPRYIRHRQQMAEKAGLVVHNWVHDSDLIQCWRGSEAAFRVTGLLGKNFKFAKSGDSHVYAGPLGAAARLRKVSDDLFEIEWEQPAPKAIRQQGSIEVLEVEHQGYSTLGGNEIWYHARAEDFLAAGVITTKQLPAMGRNTKSDIWNGWWIRREWDGWLLFGTLTEEAKVARDYERERRVKRTVLPGTAIERVENEYGISWSGTRDALIATGICNPEQFPEGRKRLIEDNLAMEGVPGDATWEAWLAKTWTTRRLRGGIYSHSRSKPRRQVQENWHREIDRQSRERQLNDVRDPRSLRAPMTLVADMFMHGLLRYASGENGRDLAGVAPCWMEDESYQRLVQIRSEVMSIVQQARICERAVKPSLRLVKN
jgi:hypothetical protein